MTMEEYDSLKQYVGNNAGPNQPLYMTGYEQGRKDERQQGLAGKILAEVWSVINAYHEGDYEDFEEAEQAVEDIENICLKYLED